MILRSLLIEATPYQVAAHGMTVVPNPHKKKDATLEYEMAVCEVWPQCVDVVTMFLKKKKGKARRDARL